MSWRAQLSKNLVELRVMFDPKSKGSVGAKYEIAFFCIFLYSPLLKGFCPK